MNMQTTIERANDTLPAIGAALDSPGSFGANPLYVVDLVPETANSFTLIGGPSPMSRNRWKIIAAREDGHITELSEHIAAPMLERARYVAPISEAEAAALYERAKVKRDENRAQRVRDAEAAAIARKAAEAEFLQHRPAWAKAALVAELDEDCSDIMTDYHGSRTLRTVVIGWSKHTRDLFPEMRKAAAAFPDTAHLADAPADAEHREKYSMGAGFYLKQGWRDSDGWKVHKRSLGIHPMAAEIADCAKATPTGDDASATPTGEAGDVGGFTISEHVHTKRGFKMWICSLAERVDRAAFDWLRDEARELGGWYSRPWGGTPGGFAFKSEARAIEFAAKASRDLAGQGEG